MLNTQSRKAYVVCASLLLGLCAATGQAKWYELQTPDFRIVSATDEGRTLKIAQSIEVWQASASKVLPRADLHPHVPVTILLLPRDMFSKYSGMPATVGGAARPGPGAAFIVVNADVWDHASSTVLHEISHLVLNQISTDVALPVWYDEGFADFLSTIKPLGNGKARVGAVPPERLAVLLGMSPWMPIKDVLTMSRVNPHYVSERLGGQFYAESWLLIHYSVLANPLRGKQINLYRDLLEKGVDVEHAFDAAFPNDNGALEKELMGYRRSQYFQYANVGPVEVPPLATDRIHEISKVDGINEIGAWQLANRFSLSPAQLDLLKHNAKGQPAQSVARLQIAKSYIFLEQPEPALAMADQGCATPMVSIRVAILCGDVYALHAAALPVKTPNLEQREEELTRKARGFYERALEIDANNIESLLAAARTYQQYSGDNTQVRAGLERVFARDSHNAEVAYQLAGLYQNTDLKKAKTYLEHSLANTVDFDSSQRVREVLSSVEKALADQDTTSASAAPGGN
jgi:hypothetical protein